MSFLTLQWTFLRSVLSCTFFFFRESVACKFELGQWLVLNMYLMENQCVGGLTANNVRNKVTDYFLADAGALPW